MYECDIKLVLYIWFVIKKKFRVLLTHMFSIYLLYNFCLNLYYLFYLNVLKCRLKKHLMEDQEVLDLYDSKNKNLKYGPY
jgi:hypothetical protein